MLSPLAQVAANRGRGGCYVCWFSLGVLCQQYADAMHKKPVTAVTVGTFAGNGLSRAALRVTAKRNRHEVRRVTAVTV